jgi:uncharacterized phiE125 gp8 family phage protein
MRPVMVTAPAAMVLTMAEVKENLRIEHDDDHNLLTGLIAAVHSYLDGPFGILRNCLLDQVWAVRGPSWGGMRLGLGNVQGIDLVRYWPAGGGVELTLPATDYRVCFDAHGAFLTLNAGVRPELALRADAVTVHFRAGYGSSAKDVPPAIRQAMQLLVGHYYKHSEAVISGARPTELPMGARALLAPYRLQRV